MRITGASRPLPGERHNGDDWFSWDGPRGRRVAVVDGLGHGPLAEEAAGQLRRLLLEAPDGPLDQVVQTAAQRMRGGRGAVAAIIEVTGSDLTFVGVGNVEGRLRQAGREQRLLGTRGFFGGPVRSLRPLRVGLEPGWALYLYTDGISSRFPLPDGLAAAEPDEVVAAILDGYARATDDATIVLVTDDAPRP